MIWIMRVILYIKELLSFNKQSWPTLYREDLEKLTKAELEELGRTFNLELDRRYKKDTLITQLLEHVNGE
jgi:hypothetical protein